MIADMKTKPSPPLKNRTTSGNTPSSLRHKDRGKLSSFRVQLHPSLNQLKARLGDLFSRVLGTILWVLLLTTIVWWITAVVILPAWDAPYNRITKALDNGEQGYLEIWSPSVVHGGSEPSEIRITLRQEPIVGEPITVEVTIPYEFVVQVPNNHLGSKISLVFTGQMEQESAFIQLINANISKGLIVSQQELNIRAFDIEKNERAVFPVPIGAEGTLRYTVRTFGGISPDKIPLFPLATLLVSIGGLWLRQYEEQRRQAEKSIDEARKRADDQFKKVRNALREGNIVSAEQELTRVRREDLTLHIEANDWNKAEQIIEFSSGKSASDTALDFSEPWLKETAGALIYVAENNPFDRAKISALLRAIPLDRLDDESRQRLQVAKEVLGSNDPAVSATWPPHPSGQQELRDLPQKTGYKDPFPKDRAENEIPLLFREENSLFWAGHPLLDKKLVDIGTTTTVIGDPGSGCTALAMALGRYYSWIVEPVPFSCHIPGTPSIAEIRFTLAERLLQFMEHNPHYLMLIGNEQKSLAAQILVNDIGKRLVLSRLETTSPARNGGWLNHAEQNEFKRKIWKAEAQAHFSLLIEATKHSNINPLPDSAWPMALTHCLRLLKFKDTILLSIDAGATFSWDWYHNVIAPHHQHWNEHGLHPIIFTSPAAYNTPRIKPALLPRVETLKWEINDLEEMLNARWRAANKTRLPLREVFPDDSKDELLAQARGNPRRLVQLWREILVERKSPIPVEKEVITKTAEDLF